MNPFSRRGLQSKTIREILRDFCEKWLKTLPKKLQPDAERDAIVTGGCIASMLLGEDVNDVDLYFRTYETAMAVARHYVAEWGSEHVKVDELLDVRGQKRVRVVVQSDGIAERRAKLGSFRPIFVSSNAITIAGHPYPLQIVLRFWGEPDAIHGTYDFVHCTNYWDMASAKLVLRPEAMESLLSRTLTYRGSLYPVCSIMRLRKFIARGWRINAGQVLKILLQIRDLDLYDRKVLEDQLTGVDSAYFEQVLMACKSGDDGRIDLCHLVECIEKCFDGEGMDDPAVKDEGGDDVL